MKIQFLGFLPFFVIFLFLNYRYYVESKTGRTSEGITVSVTISWGMLVIIGYIWAIS